MSADCGGCRERLVYQSQHATACPAFNGHAVWSVAADFIQCRCGHLSVNRVDRQSHIDDVKRLAS